MKIRTGFVSNSSSASFTLVWKVNANIGYTPEEAIDDLLEYSSEKIIEDVKRNTEKADGHNAFISKFWTCMMNCEEDFGHGALLLHFTLAMRQKKERVYEIISAEIEDNS